MKVYKRYVSVLLCFIMVLGLLVLFPFSAKATSYNEEIWFEEGAELTLEIGEIEILTISGGDFEPNSVVWKSGNDNIITIENGRIEAVGIGRTNITAKVFINDLNATSPEAKKEVIAKCVVTVGNGLLRTATPNAPITANWEYSIYNDEVTITKYKGTDTEVTIPSEIEGKPVTRIGSYAFSGLAITKVTIQNPIQSIDNSAFSRCESLQSAIFNNTMDLLSDSLFSNCSSLTEIVFPSNVKEIGENAFINCKSLENLNLPNSIEVIKKGAFKNTGLMTLEIPENTRIFNTSFSRKFKNITVDENNAFMKSKDGVLISKDESTLLYYPEGLLEKVIEIPPYITKINDISNFLYNSRKGKKVFSLYIGDNVIEFNNHESLNTYNTQHIWTSEGSYFDLLCEINNVEIKCANREDFIAIVNSDFNVTINDDESINIIEYIGSDTKLVIPERIGSKTVNSIWGIGYDNYDILETITLPNTLKKVDENFINEVINSDNIYEINNLSKIDIKYNYRDLGLPRMGVGWYNAASGGEKVDHILPNTSIYRHYKITYNDLKNKQATYSPIHFGPYESTTLPRPTAQGYTFMGWKYSYTPHVGAENETGIILQIPSNSRRSYSLFAQWQKNSSGGSGGSSTGGGGGGSSSGGGGKIGNTNSAQNTPGNWKQDEKGWWFQKTDGSYPKNEWIMHNNVWYHFDPEGYMQSGWIEINNLKYFLNPDGSMISNNWIQQNGKWYFFNPDGSMKTGWIQWNGLWYYMNPDGTMAVNITTPDGYNINGNGVWTQ